MNKKLSVLIVDDDEVVRTYLTRVFTGYGWTVLQAKSSAIALTELAKQHVNLAMIDVGLGEEDGVELAKRIRDERPTLSITMMSGDPKNEESVNEAGFGNLIRKPFPLKDLESFIKKFTPN